MVVVIVVVLVVVIVVVVCKATVTLENSTEFKTASESEATKNPI